MASGLVQLRAYKAEAEMKEQTNKQGNFIYWKVSTKESSVIYQWYSGAGSSWHG